MNNGTPPGDAPNNNKRHPALAPFLPKSLITKKIPAPYPEGTAVVWRLVLLCRRCCCFLGSSSTCCLMCTPICFHGVPCVVPPRYVIPCASVSNRVKRGWVDWEIVECSMKHARKSRNTSRFRGNARTAVASSFRNHPRFLVSTGRDGSVIFNTLCPYFDANPSSCAHAHGCRDRWVGRCFLP